MPQKATAVCYMLYARWLIEGIYDIGECMLAVVRGSWWVLDLRVEFSVCKKLCEICWRLWDIVMCC